MVRPPWASASDGTEQRSRRESPEEFFTICCKRWPSASSAALLFGRDRECLPHGGLQSRNFLIAQSRVFWKLSLGLRDRAVVLQAKPDEQVGVAVGKVHDVAHQTPGG